MTYNTRHLGLDPGYIKRAPVARLASHYHDTGGATEPHTYTCLYTYEINLPEGAKTLALSDHEKIVSQRLKLG